MPIWRSALWPHFQRRHFLSPKAKRKLCGRGASERALFPAREGEGEKKKKKKKFFFCWRRGCWLECARLTPLIPHRRRLWAKAVDARWRTSVLQYVLYGRGIRYLFWLMNGSLMKSLSIPAPAIVYRIANLHTCTLAALNLVVDNRIHSIFVKSRIMQLFTTFSRVLFEAMTSQFFGWRH